MKRCGSTLSGFTFQKSSPARVEEVFSWFKRAVASSSVAAKDWLDRLTFLIHFASNSSKHESEVL
jgi:hypothetical protein